MARWREVEELDHSYHFPPELFNLLVDTIPRLVKSKRDVIGFFRGAGVRRSMTSDIEKQLQEDRESLNKFEIARTLLQRLNEAGDATLRERRELLKRVVEFEDFSTCWENEQLAARGLVSQIQKVVDAKDSFTRMRIEREAELRKHREMKDKEAEQERLRLQTLDKIRQDLNRLFSLTDPSQRGRMLEAVLNGLFAQEGILVRESFTRTGDQGEGVVEQIDGAIEIDGDIYLVEMKWLKDKVGRGDVSEHLVRVFHRGQSRGIFISYSEYTPAAIKCCKDSLSQCVIVLCKLQELVYLLEKGDSLKDFLKKKIQGSILDREPWTSVY